MSPDAGSSNICSRVYKTNLVGNLFMQRLFIILLLLSVGSLQAQEPSTLELQREFAKRVEEITLSNGLRVLIYKRDVAPVFSGQIWIKVGGVDEVPGITGLSHFLEHMAFKGTKQIGTEDYAAEEPLLRQLDELMLTPEVARDETWQERHDATLGKLEKLWKGNEFSELYKLQGAVGLNAGTGKDYTVYMVSLPTTAIEFWMAMESERLLNPVFRQFYKEREVIQEERRMRVDNSPEGKLYEALLATAYWSHPNRLPVVGWPADMKNLSARDMQELYSHYYRPDNMVVTLVGDLDAEELRIPLEKYFGRIPTSNAPLREVYTTEPKQQGIRQAKVEHDATPQFMLAFHKPVYPNKDDAQFAVLHEVLSGGRSSLLQRHFVQQERTAVSIYTTEAPGERFPSLFIVGARPSQSSSNQELKTSLLEYLEKLKEKAVSNERVEAAKRRVRVGLLQSLQSNYGLARLLGKNELLYGDWRVAFEVYDDILKTTAADLQRLLQTYVVEDNQTYVHLEPIK